MVAEEIARLAGLLAEPSRARLCLALLDGRAWTAGELAAEAGVAPSTASEHLTRLVEGGLLVQRRQGRHRYVQLARPEVAALLEALLSHVGPVPPRPALRAVRASAALAEGRTCYDHLAGRLGVAITEAMAARGLLGDGMAVTDAGHAWLAALGPVPTGSRPLARECLDWTERRSHLAGRAGAHVCAHLHAEGWVRRVGGTRAVRVTPEGRAALRALLDLTPEG
ncbi:ArsR/SmtB family transcription factor [Saccharothrix coeruleofusca]|uniref:Transcriptional regulator n=1 Tax=Saccharothrix coeruleofusca TaxID=33919 RepID=A0A918AU08_9PSEU|nr:winged helix-turn-helix domain-containing protein [Saccharothrix coeruleofusca]MBP2338931.1 DNA-binding transcriptional ArsR family regulator [Saccharothrix coeruleofusca]GGP83214.1 transcriptional regulator [Saccharothrix coeruleofusca]